ncbi:hypothetical protein [Halobacillus sp. BBL2006]|uniref:hypothetical protein n=1 Tax=Halobacillus sp. BBL2006 TaxID=1543706 RepID=UPI000542AC9B|nr:hypothetical protein [Halobacillus sp. BBL2006]KHE73193.1 hypothetical protein LD39_00530 [Halobacillus sp. BBL2006]
MKKPIIVISLFIITFITGCNSNERITKGLVEDYYNALVNQNYEKVYEVSKIYDLGEPSSEETTFTEEEARKFFMKKVDYLEEVDYKVKSYEIVETNQQDGHTFTYEVALKIEVNGETVNRKDRIYPRVDQKDISISKSEDPLAKYRDGRVNFNIEEHWSKDIEAEYDNIF